MSYTKTISGIHSSLQWYPPAESQIPLRYFRQSFSYNLADAEEALRETIGSTHCLLGPSGRALLCQLLVAFAKKDKSQRNEVLIPGYTCYSVAAAVAKAGLKIRLYDLEPGTFAPEMDSIANNLGRKTLAVISQHLLGVPTDVSVIGRMAQEAGAWHIEDAAQALGGSLNGKPLGATGDFGLFSFGRGKPLPLGGGGALVSQRFNPVRLVPGIQTNSGWKPMLGSLFTQLAAHPLLYGFAEALPLGLGKTVFNTSFEIGQTPLALMRLIKPMKATLTESNHHRRTIATIYQKVISSRNLVSLREPGTPVFIRFPVLGRKGPLTSQLRRLGVRRLYPLALHQDPEIMAYTVDSPKNLAGVESLTRQLITLPTHHNIGAEVAEKIAHYVKYWINNL